MQRELPQVNRTYVRHSTRFRRETDGRGSWSGWRRRTTHRLSLSLAQPCRTGDRPIRLPRSPASSIRLDPVTNLRRSTILYLTAMRYSRLHRDKDGIACEKH